LLHLVGLISPLYRDNTTGNATIQSEKTLPYNNLIVHKPVTITTLPIDIY